MTRCPQSVIEASVTEALFKALRRSSGKHRILRGEEEKFKYDNVLIIVGSGINLRTLARAAIREVRRAS
jgi:hypothetical protein